jgi:hypothetical protein
MGVTNLRAEASGKVLEGSSTGDRSFDTECPY